MKYLKLFEQHNINSIMKDEDSAIEYLKSIDFFEDHGFDEDDEIIIDNIYNIIYKYRWLKNDYVTVYRILEVPSFNYIDLEQVGYFWSFDRDGVGAYDSALMNDFNKKWSGDNKKETQEIVLTATTHKDNINWLETLVSNAIYGEEQFECYLNKGSAIKITHIDDKELDNYINAKS